MPRPLPSMDFALSGFLFLRKASHRDRRRAPFKQNYQPRSPCPPFEVWDRAFAVLQRRHGSHAVTSIAGLAMSGPATGIIVIATTSLNSQGKNRDLGARSSSFDGTAGRIILCRSRRSYYCFSRECNAGRIHPCPAPGVCTRDRELFSKSSSTFPRPAE